MLVLFLVLGELILRTPGVTDLLPPPEPTLWHAELIQTKLNYLKTFEAQHGVDVLFIGNSTVQAGVDSQIFDRDRGKTVQETGAFNASIEGIPPVANLLFLEIYLRYTKPHTIIYGITPQDLNSNSPWAQDIIDRIDHAPLVWAEARHGLRGKMLAFFLEHSYLYRYRFVLHQLLLRGGNYPALPDVYFDKRGHDAIARRLSDVPPEQRGIYRNNAGVLNYSTTGVQLQSLIDLINYCKQNNIRLILVNMPLADDYYGNFDSLDDYQTYRKTLESLASEFRIEVWDLEDLPNNQSFGDADFADFNHLNQYGAEKLSHLLAEYYTETLEFSSNVNTK